MERRRFLGTLGAGLVGGTSGCLAPVASAPEESRRRVDSVAGVSLPLSRDRIQSTLGARIDAIVDPAFAGDWSDVGDGETEVVRLTDHDPVIGVAVGGRARAYPLRLLRVHEIVNDRFAPEPGRVDDATGWSGGPLLVTYCPLCDSAMTAVRTVGGRETTFGVSMLLWRSNLLMRDEATGSLWSQIAATAVTGPATGTVLRLVPSTLTTWADWTDTYPETEVLLPPPLSGTMFGSVSADRARYADEDVPGLGGEFGDDVGELTHVIGVTHEGTARAYPRPTVMAEGGVVNDVVGERPVVVATTAADTLVAYERTVGDRTITFSSGGSGELLRGGGSRWLTTTGTAIDGHHSGERLTRANDLPQLLLKSWRDFHPSTTVYGQEDA